MRQSFDFAPLFGSTVGFDHVFDLLQSATRADQSSDKFPPYDIERVGKESYKIVLAVAGFSREELSLTAERNLLTVEGKRAAADAGGEARDILHRGIGARAFKQTFQLADHVKVTSGEPGGWIADGGTGARNPRHHAPAADRDCRHGARTPAPVRSKAEPPDSATY